MAVLAPPGLSPALVQRHTQGACLPADDWLIDEQPVALVFNGLSHVVMMATPWQLDELAVGFALSEGLIDSLDALRGVEVEAAPDGLGHSVQLEVSPRAFEQIKSRRRQLEGRSGCGLCGIDSLQAFRQAWPRAAQPNARQAADADAAQATPLVNADAVQRALRALPDGQPLQARSGGCHAAAWCSPEGEVLWAREDVGRHNALDKLIGALALQHPQPAVPRREGFVLVSSRASYELVSKCARAGLPALAAVSAPTALAVELARHSGLQLMGFCRPGSAVVYA